VMVWVGVLRIMMGFWEIRMGKRDTYAIGYCMRRRGFGHIRWESKPHSGKLT
jgi:hypothetical protein